VPLRIWLQASSLVFSFLFSKEKKGQFNSQMQKEFIYLFIFNFKNLKEWRKSNQTQLTLGELQASRNKNKN
jgi:hypothetical protein